MTKLVHLTKNDSISIVTINRPETRNAISSVVLAELHSILLVLLADKKLRAVIFTGAGDLAFSAGADLKERQTMTEGKVMEFVRSLQTTFQKVAELPIPTIAAINGNAFGGGLELALACDIRVMSQTAEVGLTECSLGIIPGAGGTQRLPRIVGLPRAMELIFLAKRVSAREAFEMGLVNHIGENGEAVKALAINLGHQIAMNAPLAIRAAKDALLYSQEKSLLDGLAAELACYQEILNSKDRREGLRAFIEKRTPKYSGH